MVFIILVNYNGSADTAECIRSLQSVRSPAFRLIVVDNGSTDNSPEALRALREECPFELLEAGENLGFSAGNNLGIRYALSEGADFVLLLNNDTLVTEGFLEGLFPSASLLLFSVSFSISLSAPWEAANSIRTLHSVPL